MSVSSPWVIENVLPAIAEMKVTHPNHVLLQEAFWEFWIAHREQSVVIAHCGSPVESGLFRRCVEWNMAEREFMGPYPAIHDVATKLMLNGMEAGSVEKAMDSQGIERPSGSEHHPMYDAVAAALVWESLPV